MLIRLELDQAGRDGHPADRVGAGNHVYAPVQLLQPGERDLVTESFRFPRRTALQQDLGEKILQAGVERVGKEAEDLLWRDEVVEDDVMGQDMERLDQLHGLRCRDAQRGRRALGELPARSLVTPDTRVPHGVFGRSLEEKLQIGKMFAGDCGGHGGV